MILNLVWNFEINRLWQFRGRKRMRMPYIMMLAVNLGLQPSCYWGCSILYLVVTVGCVIYVWNDCHRGNIPGIWWSVLALVLNVVGVAIYLIYKAFQPDHGWRG